MVFVLHEHQQADAMQAVAGAESTDGYVVGDADEAAVLSLRAAGMTVHELPDGPSVQSRKLSDFSPGDRPIPGHYLVWLLPPILPGYHGELARTGARIFERRSARPSLRPPTQGVAAAAEENWYLVHVESADELARLLALTFVKAVRPFGIEERLRWLPDLPTLNAVYDVRLHGEVDSPALIGWLRGIGIEIIEESRRKLRVVAGEPALLLLAMRGEVAEIAPWRQPAPLLDCARKLVGVEPQPVLANGTLLTGKGVVIGVCDSGIDSAHPAFAGKVLNVIPRGRPNDGSDPHGHGTHVTGTIVGADAYGLRGVAPDAQVVVQSVMDANGGLGGLPVDLNMLLQEAWDKEVRIHNDSWGADTRGAYTLSSLEIDEFVWHHPEMLVVVAAGNDGTANDPSLGMRKSATGFVDWNSVGAPGSAKNALVVGACRSDRTVGGWSQLPHRSVWPSAFQDKPIAEDLVSGNSDAIAGFSSRGPCDGQRVKPDVVAPGTDVAAPRASGAPAYHFAGPVPGTNRSYGYMSGTSMATPIVTGLAALIRQYLVDERSHRPSAALIKALIINGACPLSDATAVADLQGLPNYHQGFGRVSLDGSIPISNGFVLAFSDEWADPAKAFRIGALNNRRRFVVATTATADLHVTMAYTDYYANGVQNNLDLLVDVAGKQRAGNENLGRIGPLPDPVNNVEVIRLSNAPAGTYFVSVVATNLLKDSQHFALVVAGALASNVLTEG
jgi:subtilisin family serine protease